ncbi:MAG: response regulator [Methylobacteriaceae bacterium]|nr:response regulator [Methylobacteriaceae bacterium]
MPAGVLIVEDEPLLRSMAVEFLSEAGLVTFEAENATEAIELLNRRAAEVAVLFTDVRMPGSMDGLELARIAQNLWPWLRVIVTSGAFGKPSDKLPDHADFLRKPWLPLDLLAHVLKAATEFNALQADTPMETKA